MTFFNDINDIPLDKSSTGVEQNQSELQGEIRIGTAVKRMIVYDENNVPVMLFGYEKSGF